MRVDGREIPVAGSLLQPLLRRTSDIVRLALSVLLLTAVIVGSLITRNQWQALEASVSDIVGVLSPRESDLVYLLYGIAIFAMPFAILIELIIGRRWKLLAAYGAAALIAGLLLSITGDRVSAPKWHLDVHAQLDTFLSQFLDDPRWIAMLAAVLTVAGPWLSPRWRHWWWALLLAFVPIHLVVSAVVPARSMLGLSVGWLVGAVVVLVVGTPALEVPLDAAVRVLARRGFTVTRFTVLRPAGPGPLVLAAGCAKPASEVIVELYGENQRSGGALRQVWRWFSFRSSEIGPPRLSLRASVEHRALMGMAIADLGVASTRSLGVAGLDRGWELYAHSPPRGTTIDAATDQAVLARVWRSLGVLHAHQIAHGDLRSTEIRNDDGSVSFRRIRLRPTRRIRGAAAIRHRPTADIDERDVRCRTYCPNRCGRPGREGRRDGVRAADEIRDAVTDPKVGAPSRCGHVCAARPGAETDRNLPDQG